MKILFPESRTCCLSEKADSWNRTGKNGWTKNNSPGRDCVKKKLGYENRIGQPNGMDCSVNKILSSGWDKNILTGIYIYRNWRQIGNRIWGFDKNFALWVGIVARRIHLSEILMRSGLRGMDTFRAMTIDKRTWKSALSGKNRIFEISNVPAHFAERHHGSGST